MSLGSLTEKDIKGAIDEAAAEAAAACAALSQGGNHGDEVAWRLGLGLPGTLRTCGGAVQLSPRPQIPRYFPRAGGRCGGSVPRHGTGHEYRRWR